MNIDDYRYIITIAELGSFTQAAQRLFIAQPSLSQRVKHIEKSYGITIFNRDTKGVHLTSEGECFARYAQDIIKSEEDLKRELAQMKNPEKQVLRISASQLIRSYLLQSLIHHFHAAYPHIQFDFAENTSARDQQNMLLEGKTDVGILYLPLLSKDLESQVIFQDSHVLVPASESNLEQKILAFNEDNNEPIPVSFLEGEPFASASPGTRLNNYIRLIEEKHSVNLDIQHYGKSYSTLYMIAETGIASTILYESFFDPSREYIPYYYLDTEEVLEEELQIAVAWRKKAFLSQAARSFIEFSKEFSENLSRYSGT